MKEGGAERRRKVGRNEPCPCGSGKKYKKCCLLKDKRRRGKGAVPRGDIIDEEKMEDYGKPRLDDDFFEKNPFSDFSAQELLSQFLERSDLDRNIADNIRKRTTHWKPHYDRMMRTKDVPGLVSIMAEGPDPLLHHPLIDRVLQKEEEAMPLIIAELERSWDDNFIELAVKTIYNSKMDWTSELQELMRKPVQNPYTLSLICMALGLKGSKGITKPVWDCYHFLKERFPEEEYDQGPLIALYELRGRERETTA